MVACYKFILTSRFRRWKWVDLCQKKLKLFYCCGTSETIMAIFSREVLSVNYRAAEEVDEELDKKLEDEQIFRELKKKRQNIVKM